MEQQTESKKFLIQAAWKEVSEVKYQTSRRKKKKGQSLVGKERRYYMVSHKEGFFKSIYRSINFFSRNLFSYQSLDAGR